jgi:hypothetical protein
LPSGTRNTSRYIHETCLIAVSASWARELRSVLCAQGAVVAERALTGARVVSHARQVDTEAAWACLIAVRTFWAIQADTLTNASRIRAAQTLAPLAAALWTDLAVRTNIVSWSWGALTTRAVESCRALPSRRREIHGAAVVARVARNALRDRLQACRRAVCSHGARLRRCRSRFAVKASWAHPSSDSVDWRRNVRPSNAIVPSVTVWPRCRHPPCRAVLACGAR